MDIRELRCLVTVAECRSYSKAAERLFMSRQAVAKAVASLEAQLGERLVRRQGAGVALTAEGAAAARDARVAVEAFDDFRDAHPLVADAEARRRAAGRGETGPRDGWPGGAPPAGRDGLAGARGRDSRPSAVAGIPQGEGPLDTAGGLGADGGAGGGGGQARARRLSRAREQLAVALVTGGSGGLPRGLLDRFSRAHPSVLLTITEASADDVVEMVVAGDAQVGIVGSHPDLLGGLESRLMVRQGLWLVVPAANPLSSRESLRLADLDGQPMVTAGPRNHLHRFLMRACRAQGVLPDVRATAEGTGALVQLAEENQALYFGFNPAKAPAGAVEEAEASGRRYVRLDAPGGEDFGTYELRLGGRPQARAARLFWEMAGER